VKITKSGNPPNFSEYCSKIIASQKFSVATSKIHLCNIEWNSVNIHRFSDILTESNFECLLLLRFARRRRIKQMGKLTLENFEFWVLMTGVLGALLWCICRIPCAGDLFQLELVSNFVVTKAVTRNPIRSQSSGSPILFGWHRTVYPDSVCNTVTDSFLWTEIITEL